MRLRLEALLADGNYQTLVASVADVVVGFVGTRIGRFYEGDGLYGQIMALAVEPDHRRQGIGQLLLRSAESSLVSRGVQTLVVNSGDHRADAHAFYERCGYRHTGRRFKKLMAVSA
jgi:ribosomal protein S18 acetylase RimI-like enzyme